MPKYKEGIKRRRFCGTCGIYHYGGEHTVLRQCRTCGADIKQLPRQAARKYCSRECRGLPAELPTKTCEKCGVTFTKSNEYSYATWERIRHCSRKCMGAARVGTPQTCKQCGVTKVLDHLGRPFCSQDCYWTWMRKIKYPLEPRTWSKLFTRAMKRLALERAFGCCQHCGDAKDLEYDHIIPVHQGGEGTLENCQVLCATCHLAKTISERGDVRRVA